MGYYGQLISTIGAASIGFGWGLFSGLSWAFIGAGVALVAGVIFWSIVDV